MKKLKKEQTTAFTIRPPGSACKQLERIAKSYNSNRAGLASDIIKIALMGGKNEKKKKEKKK